MPLIAGVDLGRRRGPFLSWVELLALAGMVSSLLVLLFPGSDFENPVHLARPDDLSIAYLRMLLRAHPEDAEARLLLVQQQKALGRLEDAHASLAMLHPRSSDMAARAEVVALSLDRVRLAALRADDPGRLPLLRETHAAARRLIHRAIKPAEIADLADFLLQVGDPAEAALAYRRLATLDRPNHIAWLEKAARWSEAAGKPGIAARTYAEASLAASPGGPPAGAEKKPATSPARELQTGPRLGRLALRALMAANEGRPGLEVARPIVNRFPDDLELLELAVRMAVAAGDLATARRWGEQRVIVAGSSDEALREQADILLKAGDPEGALRVAKVQLERAPDDVGLRRQVAQLARWSGRAAEALEQYTWLARRGFEDARSKSLDLARGLADSNREIEMLELSLRRVRRMAPPPMLKPSGAPGDPNAPSPSSDVPVRRPRALAGGGLPARRRPLSDAPFSVRRLRLAQTAPQPTPEKKPPPVAPEKAPPQPTPEKPAAQPTPEKKPPPVAPEKAVPQPAPEKSPAPVAPEKAAPQPAPEKPARQPAPQVSASDQPLIELVALADALEVKGLPERAIRALDSLRFNFADRPEYWSRLARLYENVGQLERALACHEQLSRLKAMNLDDSVRQAQLLWRLQRPEAALTRLVALRGQARETDQGYFALLGDLAWRLEEHVLAAEAYGALWKTQKRQEIAERLYRALEASGRRGEAVVVAEEAYERLGLSGFLVVAVDLAIKSGNQVRARNLFEKVKGKEDKFAMETHFWFQRAQLHAHENKAADAERDYQRVVRIDPRSEEAHNEWLTLAVHVQDRGMARRALDSWGPLVEKNEEAWPLLADAYALTGDAPKAERFKTLLRVARARERAASGRPLTPDEQLEEAIERRDLLAVEQRLNTYGRSLSLPMRVAGLRELGRDWDAWGLLVAAGLTDDKRLIASEDAAALLGDVRDLREQHLSGAWFWGSLDQLGPLEVRDVGARFELRARALLFGVELGASELFALPATKLLPLGRREQRARATVKLRERIGETSLRAGAAFLPEGFRPFFQAEQLVRVRDGRFELRTVASFNEVPTHSPLLRTAGVRDGLDADVTVGLGRYFEMVAGSTWARFSTRSRNFLTTEIAGRGDLAFRFPLGSAFVRPRLDAFANSVPPVMDLPADLAPFLTQREDPEDLLTLEYSNVGIGLSLGSTHGDVGEARGPHISLRYHLDGWAGYLWPAKKPSYAFTVGLGLVFAQHQELAISGFYYTDHRSAAGERWAGATLNYTLRWFR